VFKKEDDMAAESLLFRYRELSGEKIHRKKCDAIHYDLIKGLWLDENGIPIIRALWKQEDTSPKRNDEDNDATNSYYLDSFHKTTISKSQEGIDQSEATYISLGDTRITATREGIDQSEDS